jgi:hypothetical protein
MLTKKTFARGSTDYKKRKGQLLGTDPFLSNGGGGGHPTQQL